MANRELPHDLASEEALVGALLYDASQLLPIVDRIGEQGQALYSEKLRWIFQAVRAVHLRQQEANPVTVAAELIQRGKLEEIGGPSELTRLMEATPSIYHAPSYAETVRRHYEARQVIRAGQQMVRAAYDPKCREPLEFARNELAKLRLPEYALQDLTRRTSWSHAELLAADFPEPEWIVTDLLVRGALTILGGQRKRGKSWMALQLAQAVASGNPFLGLETLEGPVLFLALEDGPQRLANRLKQQHTSANLPIEYRFDFPSLDQAAGIDRLAMEIRQIGAVLAIVDTLASAKSGKLDENDAGQMAAICNPLRVIAQFNECNLLVVHHHGKGAIGDPGIDLRGSSALAAAADANLGLYKRRGESGATLMIESRDLADKDWRIEFDPVDTWCWHLTGDARQIAASENEEETLQVLDMLGEAAVGELAKELGKGYSPVRRVLERMVSKGLAIREKTTRNGRNVVLYRPA